MPGFLLICFAGDECVNKLMALHFNNAALCWCRLDYSLPLAPLRPHPASSSQLHLLSLLIISLSFMIMPPLLIPLLLSLSSSPFLTLSTFSHCDSGDRCCIYHINHKLPPLLLLLCLIRHRRKKITTEDRHEYKCFIKAFMDV